MVGLAGRVLNRGQDVVAFQKGIVPQNFLEGSTGTEQSQHVGHTESFAANTRATAALAWLDGDALKQFRFHAAFRVPHPPIANKPRKISPSNLGSVLTIDNGGILIIPGATCEVARLPLFCPGGATRSWRCLSPTASQSKPESSASPSATGAPSPPSRGALLARASSRPLSSPGPPTVPVPDAPLVRCPSRPAGSHSHALGHDVKVIAHQAPSIDLPAGFLAGLLQGTEKYFPILVILENRLPPVAMAHQVINGPGKLDGQRSGHSTFTFESKT